MQGLTEVSDDDALVTNGEGETAPALAAPDAPPEQAGPATATPAIALPAGRADRRAAAPDRAARGRADRGRASRRLPATAAGLTATLPVAALPTARDTWHRAGRADCRGAPAPPLPHRLRGLHRHRGRQGRGARLAGPAGRSDGADDRRRGGHRVDLRAAQGTPVPRPHAAHDARRGRGRRARSPEQRPPRGHLLRDPQRVPRRAPPAGELPEGTPARRRRRPAPSRPSRPSPARSRPSRRLRAGLPR